MTATAGVGAAATARTVLIPSRSGHTAGDAQS